MDENDKNTKTNKQNNFDLNEIVKKDTYNNLEQKIDLVLKFKIIINCLKY